MGASKLITPTFTGEFDAFAALVFEEVLTEHLIGTQRAVIHMDDGAHSVRVHVCATTPLTFIHDMSPSLIEDIRAGSIFQEALQRTLNHFEKTGYLTLQSITE